MLRRAVVLVFFSGALAIFVVVSLATPPPDKPIWAKKGVTFSTACSRHCAPLRIPSPDGKSAVHISYETTPDYPDVTVAHLRVVTLGRNVGEIQPAGSVDSEVTWSPDSKAFFINGNDNGYGDEHLAVHLLSDPALGPGYVTHDVEQDMAHSFPPCAAKDPSNICAELAVDPKAYIGVVGLDWIRNSSEIVVMAEMPCSSSMGGVMCQVLGYEIQVPSGKIVRRMEAKEFARRWQHSMTWKFNDPGPPKFKTKVP
jgi:hypothetical protein